MSIASKQSSEVKDKNDELTGKQILLLVVVGVVVLMAISIYEHKHYPILAEFGVNKWTATCHRGEWVYRFSTYNPHSSQQMQSIHSRALVLTGADGEEWYETRAFTSEALDQEGVWRFHVGKDPRLFVKKDKAKVLQGDEEYFDFTHDLRSLKLYLKDGSYDQLSCVPHNVE